MHILKSIVLITFLAIVSLFAPYSAYAHTSDPSASLKQPEGLPANGEDKRVKILEGYLRSHSSPLSPYAEVFIKEADKNKLDWELLPSIAGVESTFGQFLPPDSYNGWGFGIYGEHVMRFSSWEEAIATIAKSLRHD